MSSFLALGYGVTWTAHGDLRLATALAEAHPEVEVAAIQTRLLGVVKGLLGKPPSGPKIGRDFDKQARTVNAPS